MSLLGLLSMGRSFGTVRERPAPYRLANGWLPDFGRRREREFGDLGGEEVVLTDSSWPERDLGKTSEPSLFEVSTSPRAERTVWPENPAASAPPISTPRVERSRGEPWTKAVVGGNGRVEVELQGELSLEGVRVVRNDLSADDLELVRRPTEARVRGRAVAVGNPPLRVGGWRGWLAHWACFFRRRAC